MDFSEIASFIKANQADTGQPEQPASAGEAYGCTIVLESPSSSTVYGDTPLPFSERIPAFPKVDVPEKIREMRNLHEPENGSFQLKCRNFWRQGVFMQDYEDDAPWTGEFICYFPTYSDMTVRQLRGYFAWRTLARRGEYRPIPTSAAYIYVYELLNGIGADSPEDTLKKLKEFETGFLESGIGDTRMEKNLRRWMLDFAVLQNISPEVARQYVDSDLLQRDAALAALKNPEDHSDDEVFSALCLLGNRKLAESPVVREHPEEGKHLFSEIWRTASSGYHNGGKDLFSGCFGELGWYPWYPLANAVFYRRQKPEDREIQMDECRRYACRRGVWKVERFDSLLFNRDRLHAFLHAADRKLRSYFKTGHYLKENRGEAWAVPFADAVIEADALAKAEAAKPKLVIDLSGLDRIREDARETRDSLLTEEDRIEMEEEASVPAAPFSEPTPEENASDGPLDPLQLQVLRALLRGEDVSAVLREQHCMPSLMADAINEALFDEIGDTVLSCEDDKLSLVEDYRDDLSEFIGGNRI